MRSSWGAHGREIPGGPVVQRLSEAGFDFVALVDEKDRMRELWSVEGFPMEIPKQWRGTSLYDALTPETQDKARRLLAGAREYGSGHPRHLNLSFPGSVELPVEVTAVSLEDTGDVLALGRSMANTASMQMRLLLAQQELEREYWKYRSAENRFGTLFSVCRDPVLVLDWDTLHVVKANPAADEAFSSGAPLVDRHVAETMAPETPGSVVPLFDLYREGGDAAQPGFVTAIGRHMCRLRRIDIDNRPCILVYASPAHDTGPAHPATPSRHGATDPEAIVQSVLDGIVVLDGKGQIGWANRGFLDLVQIQHPDEIRGMPLGKWLDRPGASAAILLSTVSERGPLRLFRSSITGSLGLELAVEISAAPLNGRDAWVLVVRAVDGRLDPTPEDAASLGTRVSEVSALLGQVSLKELVRTVSDLVERHLIRDALEATGENRTAAAELLMMSRQTLYTKMREHRLMPGSED